MCGITAIFEPSAPTWLGAVTRAMTRMVRHRGPDGEGFAFYHPRTRRMVSVISDETPDGVAGVRDDPAGCTLALGHRRLSILDLTVAGHQPMAAADGEYWLTFNGEIYNYLEIRTELIACGHVFHTRTDTEVILAAYQEWGRACLNRFNGMFGFVLVDLRAQRFLAARDRFGVKPVYFWRTPSGGLALASEIKQFTTHPHWRANVNGQGAYDFLTWGVQDHTRETLFANVEQLRGGELLEGSLSAPGSNAPSRWYELQPAPFTGNLTEAAERFRHLLDDSVRLRLRADVPVGSCLSGGLDSSSIVCTVHKQLRKSAGYPQQTFSAYSNVPRFDERTYIQNVVTATGANPHHTIPDPDELLESLDLLSWHHDEPFGSTSIWAQWCVFRQARQSGVTVMLDGQGADEALGGYHGYFGPWLAGLLARGNLVQFAREAGALRTFQGYSFGAQGRMVAGALLPIGLTALLRRIGGRPIVNSPGFLNMALLRAIPSAPNQGYVKLYDPVRSLSRAELTTINLPKLLHWEDRNSMAHHVESRLPFLDYRLVEFCLGLPDGFKLGDGWTKRVLREGMRDCLPETIRLRRTKLGFETAEENWMKEHRRDRFLGLLQEAIDATDGVLTPAAMTKARSMLDSREPFNFLIWRLISYGRWARIFNVRLSA